MTFDGEASFEVSEDFEYAGGGRSGKWIYTLPAIPPHCKAVHAEVEIVEWLGSRVLVRDLGMKAKGVDYLIDTPLGSVEWVEGRAS